MTEKRRKQVLIAICLFLLIGVLWLAQPKSQSIVDSNMVYIQSPINGSEYGIGDTVPITVYFNPSGGSYSRPSCHAWEIQITTPDNVHTVFLTGIGVSLTSQFTKTGSYRVEKNGLHVIRAAMLVMEVDPAVTTTTTYSGGGGGTYQFDLIGGTGLTEYYAVVSFNKLTPWVYEDGDGDAASGFLFVVPICMLVILGKRRRKSDE